MQKNPKKSPMFYFDSIREIKVLTSRALSYWYTRKLIARFHNRNMGENKKEKKIVLEKWSKTKNDFLCWKGHEPEQRMERSTLKYIGMKFIGRGCVHLQSPIKTTKKVTKTSISMQNNQLCFCKPTTNNQKLKLITRTFNNSVRKYETLETILTKTQELYTKSYKIMLGEIKDP